MINAERTGIAPPISLENYVRLPHLLTSLRHGLGEHWVGDDALAKLGLRRTVVLTTPRFLSVPFLVARRSWPPCMLGSPASSLPNSDSASARWQWRCRRSPTRCSGM